MRRLSLALTLFFLGSLVALPAVEARRSRAERRKERERKRKREEKRRKREQHARRGKLNMPPDFSWPPTRQMRREGQACLRKLTKLHVRWKRGPQTRKVATPIYLRDMEVNGLRLTSIWRKGPFVMDCHLALAFAENGAPALEGLGVTEIRFSGIFSYRNVAGKRALSRHALGLAMDVWEFRTKDGVTHSVEDDYPLGDPLLLDAEQAINATGAYRLLLTPGNDPRHHYNHYHFEARMPGDRAIHKAAFAAPPRRDERTFTSAVRVEPVNAEPAGSARETTPPAP